MSQCCHSASNFGSDSLSMTFRHAAATTRARSRSRLARPYIWRLRAFCLLIWPSVCPLDHGSRRASGQKAPHQRPVRPVRGDEPSPTRGGQAGDIPLPGLHALLHDDPERTVCGLAATRSPNGSTGPWRASTRCSASAGTTTSGRSESGLGGSAKAGSTTLSSRRQAGSSVRSSAGCNAGGCGRYAAGPSEPDLVGSDWSA